ncbi:MAG: hypothetical protein AB2A00_03620 [Myxococcota bacterium]
MKRPVDPDVIVSEVLARAGKTVVDAAVLYDVAEALLVIERSDLAAEYARRAYGLALLEKDIPGAARAMTFLVSRLGSEGRRILNQM